MKKGLGCLVIAGFIMLGIWAFSRARSNNPSDLNDFGDTFLNAVWDGETGDVTRRLDAGENPNKRDTYGNNPMTLAGFAGQTEAAKLLLSRGADINSTDDSGRTALHCAVHYRHVETADALLVHGADLTKADRYGQTPLSAAVIVGPPAMVELLLDRGADVHPTDARGWQPLHSVLRARDLPDDERFKIVELLLKFGADPNAVNRGGWEQDSQHDSHVGFRPRQKPNNGNAPLAIAQSHGFKEIVVVLNEHGAKRSTEHD